MAHSPQLGRSSRPLLGHFSLEQPASLSSWQYALSDIFDVAAVPNDTGRFDCSVSAWGTPHILLTAITMSAVRRLRSPGTIARSRLDHFAMTLLQSGSAAGLAGTKDFAVKPGDIYFADLSQALDVHSSLGGDTSSEITLWIPRTRLLSSVSNEHALHGLVLSGASATGSILGASLETMAEHAPRMDGAREMDALANGVVELMARAVSPILTTATISDAPATLASFVTIRRFIDRNLRSAELAPHMIAKTFGLSRASLYRLFAPVGGVAGYIRKQRLRLVYQEITARELSNQRISQIAFRYGFTNISAFCRLFRLSYGMSPGDARKGGRRNAPQLTLKSNSATGFSIAEWLLQIEENPITTSQKRIHD